MRERRFKVLRVPYRDMLFLLQRWQQCEAFIWPEIPELPAGIEIVDVAHCFYHDAFLLKIYHETFPVADEGQELPVIPAVSFSAERLVFKKITEMGFEPA